MAQSDWYETRAVVNRSGRREVPLAPMPAYGGTDEWDEIDDAPEPSALKSMTGRDWLAAGVRTALPIIGSYAGGATGFLGGMGVGAIPGVAAGGAAGGALGEWLGQLIEGREDTNLGQIGMQGALAAIPLSKINSASRGVRAGWEAVRGAGLGAGSSVGTAAAEGRMPEREEVLLSTLLGAGMGGAVGGLLPGPAGSSLPSGDGGARRAAYEARRGDWQNQQRARAEGRVLSVPGYRGQGYTTDPVAAADVVYGGASSVADKPGGVDVGVRSPELSVSQALASWQPWDAAGAGRRVDRVNPRQTYVPDDGSPLTPLSQGLGLEEPTVGMAGASRSRMPRVRPSLITQVVDDPEALGDELLPLGPTRQGTARDVTAGLAGASRSRAGASMADDWFDADDVSNLGDELLPMGPARQGTAPHEPTAGFAGASRSRAGASMADDWIDADDASSLADELLPVGPARQGTAPHEPTAGMAGASRSRADAPPADPEPFVPFETPFVARPEDFSPGYVRRRTPSSVLSEWLGGGGDGGDAQAFDPFSATPSVREQAAAVEAAAAGRPRISVPMAASNRLDEFVRSEPLPGPQPVLAGSSTDPGAGMLTPSTLDMVADDAGIFGVADELASTGPGTPLPKRPGVQKIPGAVVEWYQRMAPRWRQTAAETGSNMMEDLPAFWQRIVAWGRDPKSRRQLMGAERKLAKDMYDAGLMPDEDVVRSHSVEPEPPFLGSKQPPRAVPPPDDGDISFDFGANVEPPNVNPPPGPPRATGGMRAVPAQLRGDVQRLLDEARANGTFDGSDNDFANLFMGAWREGADAVRSMNTEGAAFGSSGQSARDLLRALSEIGGLGIAENTAFPGEVTALMDSLNRSRGVSRSGRPVPRRSGGLKGFPGLVKSRGGKSVDTLREYLSEQPGYREGQYDNLADLLEDINSAVRELQQQTPRRGRGLDVDAAQVWKFLESQYGYRRPPGGDEGFIAQRALMPLAGALTGAAVGGPVDDEDPWRGAGTGALLGLLAGLGGNRAMMGRRGSVRASQGRSAAPFPGYDEMFDDAGARFQSAYDDGMSRVLQQVRDERDWFDQQNRAFRDMDDRLRAKNAAESAEYTARQIAKYGTPPDGNPVDAGFLTRELAYPAAGATIGAVTGPLLPGEEDNPALGMFGGAVTGGLTGAALASPRLRRAIERARYSGLLSGMAVPKSLAGNVGGLASYALEHPDRARDVGRQLFSGRTFDDVKAGWREAQHREHVTPEDARSWLAAPGRLMGTFDVATRSMMQRTGATADEAAQYVLMNSPKSALQKIDQLGRGDTWADFVTRLFLPFKRTAINTMERGVERLPGIGGMDEIRAMSGASRDLARRRQLLGAAAALGGGYLGSEMGDEGALEDYQYLAPFLAPLAGPYALPMMLGAGGGRALAAGDGVGTAIDEIGSDVLDLAPFPKEWGVRPTRLLGSFLPYNALGRQLSPVEPGALDTSGSLFAPGVANVPLLNELLLERKPTRERERTGRTREMSR